MKSNLCWNFVLLLFVVAVLEGCDTKTQNEAWVKKTVSDTPMLTSADPSATLLLPEPPGNPVASKYTGSQWELIGFANSVTGEVRTPESISDDVCYWLRLNTNRSYLLNTSADILYGSYDADTLKQTIAFFPCVIGSHPSGMNGTERTADGQTLRETFMQVSRFLESETELRLFYGSTLYLRFERREALPRPSTIAGMRWRLTGLGNDKTGDMRVPEAATKPDNYMMYTLWFRTDGQIIGHSTSNNISGVYKSDSLGTIQIQAGVVTFAGEIEDEAYTLLDNLSGRHTYSLQEDELRISYNDSLYIQFKTY
jgi:hypothetical protein